MRLRIIFDIILLVCAFIISPWYSLILAVAGAIFFQEFYEIFAVGIIADNLYGAHLNFPDIPILFTVFSGIIFVAALLIRKRLRFY